MELRHRGNRTHWSDQQMESFQILESPSSRKDEVTRNQKCLSAVPTMLVVLTVFVILNAFIYYMDNRLPHIVESNSTVDDGFVAKRAWVTLVKLANLGPRPVGSYENEVLAFDLMKSEITDIMNRAGNVYDIEMYNQKVSGSFPLNMKNWNLLLSYEGLQNVVVKIDPKRGVSDAVLLNCHFDTVPAGPGVSDNGVNCAVMIELLRILAKSPDLKRPIIFLFNGGEEIMLQAAHGFVTQHPWAGNAKYVINLDSCGAGGREILFQTTRSNSYLVDLYARTVPHPYGQVIGEELFQSGTIPSDTDFRIFRDFGNMSGLDLAHYKNGYVYHTKHDDLDRIGPSVLQNTGENLLQLTKAMSAHDPMTSALRHKSKYVFFDVLGVYMFSYTELSATVANFLIAMTSFFSFFLSLRFTTVGMNRREYSAQLLTSAISPCLTVLFAVLSCAFVAFSLDSLGRSMSWYSNIINLTVYYATASFAILLCSAVVFRAKNNSRTDAATVVSMLNGVQFFWTILLFVTTMSGLRSSYVFAVMVLFPSVVNCALGVLNVYGRAPRLWIALYAASVLVPVTFVFYLTQMFVSLFVPITGRSGPNVNPDYVIGALIAVSAYATVGYLSPIVALVKRPSTVLAVLAGTVLVSAAVVVLSPFGFPYCCTGMMAPYPKNERFDLIHTRRTFYDFGKNVRRDDVGCVIVNWDRHSPRTVAERVPKMKEAVPVDCAGELLCGVPFPGKLALHSSWIPLARPPTVPRWPSVDVTLDVVSERRRRRMVFNVTAGPERINVYASPYPGTGIISWSFTDGRPEPSTQWEGHDVYVIKHSRGDAGTEAWNFWLEQDSEYGFQERTINITVAFNWVTHGNNTVLEDEFKTFVNSFPPWAHVNYAVARVDAFVY